MAETNLDAFKGKDSAFAADWLKSKGPYKLCSVFKGMKKQFIIFEYINILNCIYNRNNDSIQYRRRRIRFIEVNCFDRPGVFMYNLIHLRRLICRCINNGMTLKERLKEYFSISLLRKTLTLMFETLFKR